MAVASAITEKNIDKVEKETMKIASGTLSALESALAAWEASKQKPEEMAEKFKRYAEFRSALAAWMTRMLRAEGDGEDLKTRQARLYEFVSICREYKKVK